MLSIIIIILQIINYKKSLIFFYEIFLFASFNIDVMWKILFFIFNRVEVYFLKLKLHYKIYTYIKIIQITKKVKVIQNKEFTITVFSFKKKNFVIYKNSLLIFDFGIEVFS